MSERGSAEAAHRALRESTAQRIRTITYGNVISYDPAQRRARVQPGRMQRRRGAGETPSPLPVIPGAPVAWPRFAGMVIEGRLDPGDPVLLLVSDRELDGWMATGASPVPPKRRRMHDLTDAIVLAGILTAHKLPTAGTGNPAELWIGQQSRLAGLAIGIDLPTVTIEAPVPGGIRLGRGAASPAVLGTQLMSAIGAMLTAGAGTGGVGVPEFVAAQAAWNAALLAANPLSEKVLIE